MQLGFFLAQDTLESSPAPIYCTSGWLVVVWLVVVSSSHCLYVVALWRGCRNASSSAWGPFWPPVPRPRLRPQRQSGGGGIVFPLRGGVWAE
jgi:hypothetical protein